MNVFQAESGAADAAEAKKKKRQAIMDTKTLNIWQKKDLLDQLDEEYARLIPAKPQAAAKPNVSLGKPFKPTYEPAAGQTAPGGSGTRLFAGLPGQKKADEPQKKAVVRNPFTYLNQGQQDNPGKRLADPVLPGGQTYESPSILKKLTAEDYVRAWENRDWNTTEAYANGIRNGSISDTGMAPSQRQRFQDATLNQLTQPQMNLVSGVLGVGNGVSMDLLESSLRMNANRQDETGRLAQSSLHVIDRLKDEASVGYQIGYGVGQMIPIYGAGSVAGETVGNVVKQPYLREAAIGALSTAAPTVVSGIAQGKPAGQIALETANNAALGTLYGMGLRYLGEVLPQPGTIPYYQMEGRGGFQKKLAPIVGGIAQGLNPNGVVVSDDLGVGYDDDQLYNYDWRRNSEKALFADVHETPTQILPNGYSPQQGERTFNSFLRENVGDVEIGLYTKSAGFNNNKKSGIGGQFKRFGTGSHGGIEPHVHQPRRNVNLYSGEIFGLTGRNIKNGEVTPPDEKDMKQLYEYLFNNKYR